MKIKLTFVGFGGELVSLNVESYSNQIPEICHLNKENPPNTKEKQSNKPNCKEY